MEKEKATAEAKQTKAVKEMASVLRSTERMAARFAKRVQERVDEPVSHTEILQIMRKMSAKRLSMGAVVDKIRKQQRSA